MEGFRSISPLPVPDTARQLRNQPPSAVLAFGPPLRATLVLLFRRSPWRGRAGPLFFLTSVRLSLSLSLAAAVCRPRLPQVSILRCGPLRAFPLLPTFCFKLLQCPGKVICSRLLPQPCVHMGTRFRIAPLLLANLGLVASHFLTTAKTPRKAFLTVVVLAHVLLFLYSPPAYRTYRSLSKGVSQHKVPDKRQVHQNQWQAAANVA